jgi:mannosyl-3-phosphoglycerate phosphatase
MLKKKPPGKIIFTDLNGTLIDRETLSWDAAKPALQKAKKRGVPVIFCTSRTRAETEFFRKKIGNNQPFIVENGGAIYIPRNYFHETTPDCVKKGKYLAIQFGRPYKEIREVVKEMRRKGLKVSGFGDMSILTLRKLSGMTLKQAHLSKKREFDEPFILENPKQEQKVQEIVKKHNLRYIKGRRFYHLMGNHEKGLAVKILTSLYNDEAGFPVVTAGIGDSPVDFSMLRAVHIRYLVKRIDGSHASKHPDFIRTEGIGPRGWNEAMTKFVEEEF